MAIYFLIILIGGFRLSVEALAGTFYWMVLATWGTHFLLHLRLPLPTGVPVRTSAGLSN
jgi:hypothetical protein